MSTRLLVSLCAATGALLLPTGAQARYVHRHLVVASIARALPANSPETVVQDDAVLLHGTDAQITDALGKIRALGIDRVRVTAGWSVIAPQPDSAQRPTFDDTDPAAYPPGNWDNLDRIVKMADAVGVKVMIDIAFWAPRWATQSRPDETIRLRTNIDPVLYAHFATAVARRYSGTWTPPAPPANQPPPQPEPSPDGNFLTQLFGGGKSSPPPPPAAPVATTPPPVALPAVDIFTIWNEPNHPGFLAPQWTTENGHLVPHSADIYRAMVRAAYPAIKAVAPNARVLIGATSSGGATQPGHSGVTPMKFLRRFACVDDRWRPITTGSCAGFTTIPGDGWSHHPYSLRTLPDAIPHDPDKLPVANTASLLGALHRLVVAGRLAPANQDLYMTEYGYETSPPDPQAVFGPGRQAQLLSWAEFIATRSPRVRMWPQFQLIDRPGDPAGPTMRAFGDWQSGLYYADWSPKPAAATYRTPTFAACVDRGGRRRVMVWGRVREGQRAAVTLDREVLRAHSAAVRPVAHIATVPADRELLRFVSYVRGARYRLTWATAQGTLAGPAVAPVDCGGS
jgi:hypothetical protein